jgi:hypothetical protein
MLIQLCRAHGEWTSDSTGGSKFITSNSFTNSNTFEERMK